MALRIIFTLGFFALMYCLLAKTAASETKIDKDVMTESANQIGKKLKEVMEEVTSYTTLKTNYKAKDFEINQRKGPELVKEMKKDLEKILQNKIQSIMNLADKAEMLFNNYTYNKDIMLPPAEEADDWQKNDKYFQFLDSKDLVNTGNITLKEEVTFSNKIEVNLKNSTVHVPTDVYKGSHPILNTAKWSKGLDEIFIKNRKEEPSLLWQYFGSYTGVYRVYPGYKWRQPNDQDYFDHRRRGWYIQGSSSPKDMVILLDLSGSMIGNKLAISKLSAMSLLDTLQENDFVNIVVFNSKASMLCEHDDVMTLFKKNNPNFEGNCTRSLLQATKQNKKYLKKMVNFVKAKAEANVNQGFNLAVEVLKNASRSSNQSSSGCIKTINFFTDGVEDNEHQKTLDVLSKAGTTEAKIRIFGYLVGREKGSPYFPVQDIACKYRGYFYTVETLSDVRENVTRYLSVLGRPQGLEISNHPVSWTPIYLDEGGLGLMITVVTPVYDKEKKQSLLGVVGTDVALPQLKASIPEAKVGVNGYGFAINNNGFVVIHPSLKDDKSSATNLLLQDVNLEDSKKDIENLTRGLIDKQTGSMEFEMRVLSKNKKRVSKKRIYYFSYTDINGTSFSSGIALTKLGRNYFKIKDVTRFKDWKKAMGYLKAPSNETVMVSPWDICPHIVPKLRASTPLYQPVYADAEDLIANLTNQDDVKKLCDEVLFYQLLYGAEMTNNLAWDIEVNDTNGYLSVFVGTNGGFSRVRAPGGESPIGSDVTVEPFYQRASEFKTDDIIVTAKANSNEDIITASSPIFTENGEVLAAVIGMQMKGETLQEILLNSSQLCKDEDDKWGCYLLDEDGYIVAANTNQTFGEVGKRFGDVHGDVFKAMVENNLYDVVKYKNSNSKCASDDGSSSNAMRLINPLLAVSSYVIWMTQTLFWSMVQFNIYSFFSAKSKVLAETSSDENFCTDITNYYKASDMKSPYTHAHDGKCSSDNCVGKFFVAPVSSSNLRLIILQNDCCKRNERKKFKYIAKGPYFALPPKQYRKLPQLKCYAYSSEESKECGSGCSLSPTKVLIALLMLLYPFFAH